uniref:Uncharacterized protein n=1 Tax=Anguilla anguilla TaxID=7936 RepID=A0A0E9Q141_ANGAN
MDIQPNNNKPNPSDRSSTLTVTLQCNQNINQFNKS